MFTFLTDLKTLFTENTKEAVELLFLVVFACICIVVSIKKYVSPSTDPDKAHALILAAISFLMLHLILERFTILSRQEKSLKASAKDLSQIKRTLTTIYKETELRNLPIEVRREANKLIRNYSVASNLINSLQRDDKDSQFDNKKAADVIKDLLSDQSHLLEHLAKGEIEVANDQINLIHKMLSQKYLTRFDAVSEDDLDFWIKDARPYLDIGSHASTRRNTQVTRIFIFNLEDLNKRGEHIAEVLIQQQNTVAWAIAIQEELDEEVKRKDVSLDFALYDSGKAISIFRLNRNRRFRAIFSTPENQPQINLYREVYRDLVAECWLVSSKFNEGIEQAISPEALKEVKRKTSISNANLVTTLKDITIPEGQIFVQIANLKSVEEAKGVITGLYNLVKTYRQAHGKD